MAKRTASAKKQARAGVKRALRNRAVRSEVKTKVVKARRSLVDSPVAESERFAVALEAVRALDRAASKGILHRRNASRRKSRLAKQMARLGVASGSQAVAAGATASRAPAAATKGKGKKPVVNAAPASKPAATKAGTAKKAAAPK